MLQHHQKKRTRKNRKEQDMILQSLYELSQAIREFAHHQNRLLELMDEQDDGSDNDVP